MMKDIITEDDELITVYYGEDVKEGVKALLETAYEVEWLMLSEPGVLHATPENAAKIQARFEGIDCVVGVGGGTICK